MDFTDHVKSLIEGAEVRWKEIQPNQTFGEAQTMILNLAGTLKVCEEKRQDLAYALTKIASEIHGSMTAEELVKEYERIAQEALQ